MSLVLAYKENGYVYFAADTQQTSQRGKFVATAESERKIYAMPHGLLVGTSGLVSIDKIFLLHEEWFDAVGKAGLSKEFLTTVLVPYLTEELKKEDLLDGDALPEVEMNASFLFGWRDRLYYMDSTFAVYEIPRYAAIGCGAPAAFAVMSDTRDDLTMREKALRALKITTWLDTKVGKPYWFADTETMKFEITEETV